MRLEKWTLFFASFSLTAYNLRDIIKEIDVITDLRLSFYQCWHIVGLGESMKMNTLTLEADSK